MDAESPPPPKQLNLELSRGEVPDPDALPVSPAPPRRSAAASVMHYRPRLGSGIPEIAAVPEEKTSGTRLQKALLWLRRAWKWLGGILFALAMVLGNVKSIGEGAACLFRTTKAEAPKSAPQAAKDTPPVILDEWKTEIKP